MPDLNLPLELVDELNNAQSLMTQAQMVDEQHAADAAAADAAANASAASAEAALEAHKRASAAAQKALDDLRAYFGFTAGWVKPTK